MSAVHQNPLCPSQVGTGGQKNDLKLWDLDRPEEPIFRAKNVIINFCIFYLIEIIYKLGAKLCPVCVLIYLVTLSTSVKMAHPIKN